MARTRASQSKHDRRVRAEAESYEARVYAVWADLRDWLQPRAIKGKRPDVIAEKGSHTTVVEVETPDSVDSARDLAQQAAFKAWREELPGYRHYRRVVTE